MGWQRMRDTWVDVQQFRDLRQLLISVFFSMAGIAVIVSFAFIYGAQVIQWDDTVRTYMFIVVQITAAIGAIGFGILQSRIGAKLTYQLSQGLWVFAILAIWLTPDVTELVNTFMDSDWQAQHVFLMAGCMAGLSLGSAQSAGRALVGVLTPPDKSAEFFGLWGTSAKLAAVFGIMGIGICKCVWSGNAICFAYYCLLPLWFSDAC